MDQTIARGASPSSTNDAPRQDEPSRLVSAVAWATVGVCGALIMVLLMRVGRGTTWFFDEWDWVLQRRGGGIDTILRNHNGHLNALPVLVYKAWWSLFGLQHYAGMRALEATLHLAICVTLFVYLRQRVQWWLAVAATVAILALGYAWQDLLWPFQMQYLGSILAGLLALLLVARGSRRNDIAAAIALAVALACSGVGLPFVGAIGLRFLLRRRTWNRLWVVLVPLGLYGLWYLEYGQSQAKGSNVHLVPAYMARAGAASAGALFGTGLDTLAWVAGTIMLILVISVLVVRRTITPELACVLVLPLSFWALTALSRADANEPGASRYLYPGAIFIVLIGAELVGDPQWPRTTKARWAGAVLAAVVLVISVAGNVAELRRGGASLRDVSTYLRAELTAVELARGQVASDFRPDLVRAPQISAGPYLEAVRDLGSPANTPAEVARLPEAIKISVDGVLGGAVRARLTPSGLPAAQASCRPVGRDGASGATTELEDPPADFVVVAGPDAPLTVAVRSFADAFDGPPLGIVPPGATRKVALPHVDGHPWHVELRSDAAFQLCEP